MLKLDHLVVVAPTLADGVSHVRTCLDIDVPFGARHDYMGTHNHLLQLGGAVYLEIVALDPDGEKPNRLRWFGLENQRAVKANWDAGRRLRGWVANTETMDTVLAGREQELGFKVSLPPGAPSFDISLSDDGCLPLDGAGPTVIDRRGVPRSMASIPDLGAKLLSFSLEHPDMEVIALLYQALSVDRPPIVVQGAVARYRAKISTPGGVKELT